MGALRCEIDRPSWATRDRNAEETVPLLEYSGGAGFVHGLLGFSFLTRREGGDLVRNNGIRSERRDSGNNGFPWFESVRTWARQCCARTWITLSKKA